MNVVECIPSLQILNGAENLFVNLCVELTKKVNLYVILLYDGLKPSVKKIFDNNSIKFYFLGKQKGIDFIASKKFKKLIISLSPDVIHTHLDCLITYFFAFKFRKEKWKLVHTVHNEASKETTFFNKIIRKQMLKRRILIDIAISDLIKTTLINEYKVNRDIPVIYNGVPIVHQKKRKKQFDFIICARFVNQKNHMILMKAIQKLNKLNFFPSLICVGDGNLLNEVKQYVLNNYIKNVFFIGRVNNVYKYLLESRIFVLPSSYEGNPISILEAMEFGLPIIASNVGGIPDIIKNGINGFLVKPSCVDDLSSKMLLLLKSPLIVKKISANNKNDIKKYSINKCANDYCELFNRLIKN